MTHEEAQALEPGTILVWRRFLSDAPGTLVEWVGRALNMTPSDEHTQWCVNSKWGPRWLTAKNLHLPTAHELLTLGGIGE